MAALVATALPGSAQCLGAGRARVWRLAPGDLAVPSARGSGWRARSALADRLLARWAARELPDWKTHGKVQAPRILLAKLALGRDLEEVNAYLCARRPWGESGSSWPLHPRGDYDFTEIVLAAILHLFGDDEERLQPATRRHLIDVLLVDRGDRPRRFVPGTFGRVRETENHLLMTEGSRYLRGRWLALHGGRAARGSSRLESWLVGFLDELEQAGFHEFNSLPYEGYSLTALLVLEAFGSAALRARARALLDRRAWTYALGSLGLRRCAPFRRQLGRAGERRLDVDGATALMKVWVSFWAEGPVDVEVAHGLEHALLACVLPYRPPERAVRWALRKPSRYFVRLGHGPGASPEIYAGGPGYLLSAGGVHRGLCSRIAARPITLLLDDGARTLDEVVHLAGPGPRHERWNSTGVWRDFAVAAGPVHVPRGWRPEAVAGSWAVYVRGGLRIAVHSGPDLGVVAIFHDGSPRALAETLAETNPDPQRLRRTFHRPGDGRVDYDVDAPADRWVLEAADGGALERRFDTWPLGVADLDG